MQRAERGRRRRGLGCALELGDDRAEMSELRDGGLVVGFDLDMTLVDNRDGRVLWHVAQRFPASAASPADVTRAAQALLSTLPAAR